MYKQARCLRVPRGWIDLLGKVSDFGVVEDEEKRNSR